MVLWGTKSGCGGISVIHLKPLFLRVYLSNRCLFLILCCTCDAGGYLAHSLAIMTDAAHLLTDFGSMMVSLFSLWISSRPPTKIMNFGWHRSGKSIPEFPSQSYQINFTFLFYIYMLNLNHAYQLK